MTIWFTADTHFGHAAIIGHCSRPYRSVRDMDFDLVRRWNAAVGSTDEVWHLGDFAWRGHPDTRDIFLALRGRKRLVIGNHDTRDVVDLPWAEPPTTRRVIEIDGLRVLLSHEPTDVAGSGADIVLYGHMHGRDPGTERSMDVGIDAVEDRAPIPWAHVRALLSL